MADDIEDLLLELEDAEERDKNATEKEKKKPIIAFSPGIYAEECGKSENDDNTFGDEIDSILNEDVDIASTSTFYHPKNFGSSLKHPSVVKCSLPMLSGVDGRRTIKGCENLLCLSCDSPVISFEGFRWQATTDYLFLRNNYPDKDKLKSQLDSSRPQCAYACQCSFLSVSEALPVNQFDYLKWVCKGHNR